MGTLVYSVGDICETCNNKMIAGREGGAYCWNCWKKGKEAQPANPTQPIESKVDVDWDKIAEGKVRSKIVLEAYKMDKPLIPSEINLIEEYVRYSMTGSTKPF